MKKYLSLIKNILIFTKSYLIYKLVEKRSTAGYLSMLNLFCKTGGISNDLMSKLISFNYKVQDGDRQSDYLGNHSSEKIDLIVEEIKDNGFCILDSKLDAQAISYFMDLSKKITPYARLMDDEIKKGCKEKGRVPFDKSNLVSIRYDYPENELICDTKVQDLMGDPVLTAIAERYLCSEPQVDITTLWWHTNFSKRPDDNSATMYHFDMDRIKWLKVFFYITDVGPDNGPHVFVKNSHRTRGIPQRFLEKGYVRLSDEEVEAHYGKEDIIEFSAPRGTIIIEDTRGLHKGKHLEEGDRLIFQLEYTNSLFGSSNPSNKMINISSKTLQESKVKYKKLLQWYGQ